MYGIAFSGERTFYGHKSKGTLLGPVWTVGWWVARGPRANGTASVNRLLLYSLSTLRPTVPLNHLGLSIVCVHKIYTRQCVSAFTHAHPRKCASVCSECDYIYVCVYVCWCVCVWVCEWVCGYVCVRPYPTRRKSMSHFSRRRRPWNNKARVV